MSSQRQKTYTAIVGWKRDLAGFAGVITGIPEIRATAPTLSELTGELGQALQGWLERHGERPIGEEIRVQAVRVDA